MMCLCWRLFFAAYVAVFLVASLAQGASPGSLPVPLPAQQAGFNTPVLIEDFSHPLKANWLGGCPNGPDGSPTNFADEIGPHFVWNNLWWRANNAPCNVTQTFDNKANSLVLDIPWTVTGDYWSDYVGHTIQIGASWNYGGADSGQLSLAFPNKNFYAEIVARVDPVVDGVRLSVNTWPIDGIVDGACGIEWDLVEETSNEGPFQNVHNFCNGTGDWIWTWWDDLHRDPAYNSVGEYHKFALLVTSDGNTAVGCGLLDDKLIKCGAPTVISPEESPQRDFWMIASNCDVWDRVGQCPFTGGTQHAYIKSFRVFSCKDWQTTQCNRPVIGP